MQLVAQLAGHHRCCAWVCDAQMAPRQQRFLCGLGKHLFPISMLQPNQDACLRPSCLYYGTHVASSCCTRALYPPCQTSAATGSTACTLFLMWPAATLTHHTPLFSLVAHVVAPTITTVTRNAVLRRMLLYWVLNPTSYEQMAVTLEAAHNKSIRRISQGTGATLPVLVAVLWHPLCNTHSADSAVMHCSESCSDPSSWHAHH